MEIFEEYNTVMESETHNFENSDPVDWQEGHMLKANNGAVFHVTNKPTDHSAQLSVVKSGGKHRKGNVYHYDSLAPEDKQFDLMWSVRGGGHN